MPSASVQAMSRRGGVSTSSPVMSSPRPSIPTNPDISLIIRDFFFEGETSKAGATSNNRLDKEAFLRAQREAFQALNDEALARAIRASEETAALEEKRRREANKDGVASSSVVGGSQSAPVPPRGGVTSSSMASEATSRPLAHSRRTDPMQSGQVEATAATSDVKSPLVPKDHNILPSREPVVAARMSSTTSAKESLMPSAAGSSKVVSPSLHPSMASTSRHTSHEASTSSTRTASATLPTSQPGPSKRASVSARDLRLGLAMSPSMDDQSMVNRISISPEHESQEHRDIFVATRSCSKCGKAISSPRNPITPQAYPFAHLIHATCSSCATNHCRGCFTVVSCLPWCHGKDSCVVRNCCPEVQAIAIFEALSSFDVEFATEAGLASQGSREARQEYIRSVIAKPDKNTRRFEASFVKALRAICSWLQGSSFDSESPHPTVQRIISVSYLPEVIRTFLSNNNVRDWVAHSETYLCMLEVLRRMVDSGLSDILTEPLRVIEQSCGLQHWIWDLGSITWKCGSRNEPVRLAPLQDLVKQLEAHRRPLMALAAKVQFPATVEKVNSLCDGISYLLLQQVVDG